MKKILICALAVAMLAGCSTAGLPGSSTSALPEPARTATPALQIVRTCPTLQTAAVTLQSISAGTVLQTETASLLDLQTGRPYTLPSGPVWWLDRDSAQVSPDGTKFAYLQIIQNQLFQTLNTRVWVVDAHGQELARISFGRRSVQMPRWLDNQRLLLYTDQTYQDGSVLLLDTSTGKQQTVADALPGLATRSVPADVKWRAEYSPTLDRVIYLGSAEVILRDTLNEGTIWEQPVDAHAGRPVWAPDGQAVAVPDNGLSVVTRSGQTQHLPGTVQPGQAWVPVWSPDGGRLAFWKDGELAIYDVLSRQLRELCIKDTLAAPPAPGWSADSRQLLVYGYPELQPGTEMQSLLLDLQKELIYTNAAGLRGLNPLVWLHSIP